MEEAQNVTQVIIVNESSTEPNVTINNDPVALSSVLEVNSSILGTEVIQEAQPQILLSLEPETGL